MSKKVKVAEVNDINEGEGRVVQVDGKAIALFRSEGGFYAIDNVCAHRGGPLGEGSLDGDVVVCPWHGWEYNIKTGVSPANPATKVLCFKVAVEGSDVMIEV